MSFPVSDAAFAGFRLTREHPRAILIWTGVLFLLHLATSLMLTGMAGPALDEFATMDRVNPDAERMAVVAAAAGPVVLMTGLLSVAVYGVIVAAATRAVLEPARSAAGYLRLGKTEAVQILTLLVLTLAGVIVLFILSVALAGLLGSAGPVVVQVATVAALLAILGRFILAGPMAFASGKLDLSGAWALSRGRWRPLFGALLLASALAAVVTVLCLVVFTGLATVALGGEDAAQAALQPDFSSVQAYLTPVRIAYTAFVSLVTALVLAILAGVGARAYQILRETGGA